MPTVSIFDGIKAQVRLDPDSRTTTWPNTADFAPDFLYQLEPEGESELASISK